MNLMAIILWALYPFSPMRRVYELVRRFLAAIIRNLEDEAFIAWLRANRTTLRASPASSSVLTISTPPST